MVISERRARVFLFYMAFCFFFNLGFLFVVTISLGYSVFEDEEWFEEAEEFYTYEEGFYYNDDFVVEGMLLDLKKDDKTDKIIFKKYNG